MSYSSGKTLENVVLIIQKMPLGILQQFALKVVDKHVATEIAEDFSQRIASQLRKELDDKLRDLSRKESNIKNLVEEKSPRSTHPN